MEIVPICANYSMKDINIWFSLVLGSFWAVFDEICDFGPFRGSKMEVFGPGINLH